MLPLLPCDQKKCDWYIYERSCNNCFWFLSELFADKLLDGLSFKEIAEMENITPEEASNIYEEALTKCRGKVSSFLIKKDKE